MTYIGFTERPLDGFSLTRIIAYLIAAVFCILVFLFSVSSFYYPGSGRYQICFFISVLYYFSLHRSALFPVWLASVFGLLFDIMLYVPLGLHAFIFTGLYMVMEDQRRLFQAQSFAVIWTGFFIFVLAFNGLRYVLTSLLFIKLMPVFPFFADSLVNVMVFPLFYAFLNLCGFLAGFGGPPKKSVKAK